MNAAKKSLRMKKNVLNLSTCSTGRMIKIATNGCSYSVSGYKNTCSSTHDKLMYIMFTI